MSQPIIHFDYDFSPYGQKTKLLLTAAGVDFVKNDQPRVLPRPDLEALGITYRRIPLLAIGKDIYADSSRIIEVIIKKLAKSGAVATSPADKAYEEWGNSVFHEVLGLLNVDALGEAFVKDRSTIFPVVKRPDVRTLKPSTLAGFISREAQIENDFLVNSSGPFIGGEKLSLADVHVLWSLRWALHALGAAKEVGTGKDAFPKLWKAIESLPEAKPEVLSTEETHKRIRSSGYSAGELSVQKDDPLGIKAGTVVTVESFDSEPGSHPQVGKLVGTSTDEVVLEVGNDGVRLHFPRIGYIVREQ